MLVLSLPAYENKKYTAYDRFHGNGPYGELLTKKEPIRMLRFALLYIIIFHISFSQYGKSDEMRESTMKSYCNTVSNISW